MTSINIIALNKKFAFMRWSFLGAFCPKYLYNTISNCIFTKQGVLKIVHFLKWAKNWDIRLPSIKLLPEKVFPYELELFWSLLSQIHGHTYSKCIFTIQGVQKKWTMPWHRLKMELYDFNHYCYSPKKKFMRLSLLVSFGPKYIDILI